jgi:hypothetical protein
MDISMNGLPDGHVTDYEKAVDAPLRTLAWVEPVAATIHS